MSGDSSAVFKSTGADSEFEPVASVADLGEGMLLQRVRSTGEAVCLIRHDHRISAVSDICTHEHFSMSLGDLLPDGTLQCAWHGARYDSQTGEVKQVPATSPLPVFQVRLDGDTILVGPRCKRIDGRYEASAVSVP
ncbi:MAG TPA: Rieske 2Fe-2S domain-containing protein [Gemmatimonadaceae bacterium]|jgi:3-phenylpropionate/trans-cinnamate dioxygenase ferredoxin subunit|nr:Rieske 2Fe-2S domain-containing protein [Gemmatimonadaceae bacterium]